MKIFNNSNNKSGSNYSDFVSDDFFNGEEYKFHKSLEGYSPVPVVSLNVKPTSLTRYNIFIKDESKRFHLKAFKALGASYAIHKFLLHNPGEHIFCTATDGNHGRAVAWASTKHKMKSVIFVPKNTNEKIISNIKNEGADVRVIDADYDTTVLTAKNFSDDIKAILIQDTSFDGYLDIPRDIMQGYLTQMREVEIPIPDVVILQAGVGTWAAAIILYYLKYFPDHLPKFIVIEPDEVACCYESAIAGKPVKAKGNFNTVMVGLNCGTPSITAFEVLKSHADYFVTIPDSYINSAREVYKNNHIESGQTGASGLAGLLAIAEDTELISEMNNILVFNSEGEL